MGIAERIYQYSSSKKKVSNEAIDELKKRIADSIFTAYVARNSPPIKISKKVLLPSKGPYNSSIYFSKEKAPAEVAAFINGSMTRYMDYNDTYLSKEAIHPSDNIAPILAVADSVGAGGSDALKAIFLSYQVACAFADASSVRDRGWDHVVYISASSAAGLAQLLSLDEAKFSNAISLSLNNSVSMRQTRVGALSMWKACTVGDAARNSVFGTLLAKGGLTGPSPIFEGEMGFFKQVSGNLTPNLLKERPQLTMIKAYPVEYHAMSAVQAALSLRNRIKGRIDRISIETFGVAYEIIVKGPEKLRPKNKETADHSLPYIIAYALLYGEPTPNSYGSRYLNDRNILALINRTRVATSKKFDKMYPKYTPARISVSAGGKTISEEVDVQKGHAEDPFTWDELKGKGMMCMHDERIVNEIIKACRTFNHNDVSDIFEVIQNVDIKR